MQKTRGLVVSARALRFHVDFIILVICQNTLPFPRRKLHLHEPPRNISPDEFLPETKSRARLLELVTTLACVETPSSQETATSDMAFICLRYAVVAALAALVLAG
jgi:hypothetical protein